MRIAEALALNAPAGGGEAALATKKFEECAGWAGAAERRPNKN